MSEPPGGSRELPKQPTPVFTPDNEPYLGLADLQAFDETIVILMEQHNCIGPWTRIHRLNDLQKAASQLAPQASSLLLALRELIRQGYLLPAAVLLRPALERIATLSWLCDHPSEVHRWQAGWLHGQRPSLAQRMTAMYESHIPDTARAADQVRNSFNGLIHGDPTSANMGAVLLDDGKAAFTVSKDLFSPARASDLAAQGAMYAIVLTARCGQCFPSLTQKAIDGAS
jgi:hypothetical protein